jgi:hypothetical protein
MVNLSKTILYKNQFLDNKMVYTSFTIWKPDWFKNGFSKPSHLMIRLVFRCLLHWGQSYNTFYTLGWCKINCLNLHFYLKKIFLWKLLEVVVSYILTQILGPVSIGPKVWTVNKNGPWQIVVSGSYKSKLSTWKNSSKKLKINKC